LTFQRGGEIEENETMKSIQSELERHFTERLIGFIDLLVGHWCSGLNSESM